MWVLGLYKLSWPANGSFKYVDMFFLLFFFCCCLFFLFFLVCLFVFLWGGTQEHKG